MLRLLQEFKLHTCLQTLINAQLDWLKLELIMQQPVQKLFLFFLDRSFFFTWALRKHSPNYCQLANWLLFVPLRQLWCHVLCVWALLEMPSFGRHRYIWDGFQNFPLFPNFACALKTTHRDTTLTRSLSTLVEKVKEVVSLSPTASDQERNRTTPLPSIPPVPPRPKLYQMPNYTLVYPNNQPLYYCTKPYLCVFHIIDRS